MCVIVTGTQRKPDLDTLTRCEKHNDHGGGMAWATRSGEVVFRKDMKAEEMHTILSSLKNDRPWACHFRLATVGGKTAELNHPFPIEDDVPLAIAGKTHAVLFHNGHWGDWQNRGLQEILRWGYAPLTGALSDSRVVAWMVHHHGPGVLRFMPGKFCVLDGDKATIWPDPDKSSDWTERDGIFYSNTHWDRSYTPSYTSSYQGHYGRSCPPTPELKEHSAASKDRELWTSHMKESGWTLDRGVWIPPKQETKQLVLPPHDGMDALCD